MPYGVDYATPIRSPSSLYRWTTEALNLLVFEGGHYLFCSPVRQSLFEFHRLVVHAESYVTVRFVRRRISALAKLEMEPPFQRFAALICTFSLCSLVTELPAWTTRVVVERAFYCVAYKLQSVL